MDQIYIFNGARHPEEWDKTVDGLELYLNPNEETGMGFKYAKRGYSFDSTYMRLCYMIDYDPKKLARTIAEEPEYDAVAIIQSHFKMCDSLKVVEYPENPRKFSYEDKVAVLKNLFSEYSWFENSLDYRRCEAEGLNPAGDPAGDDDSDGSGDLDNDDDDDNMDYHPFFSNIKINPDIVKAYNFLWEFFRV